MRRRNTLTLDDQSRGSTSWELAVAVVAVVVSIATFFVTRQQVDAGQKSIEQVEEQIDQQQQQIRQGERALTQAKEQLRLQKQALEEQRTASLSEEYSRTVNQLASDQESVRVDAVTDLTRIASDSPDKLETVMRVLGTHLRASGPATYVGFGGRPTDSYYAAAAIRTLKKRWMEKTAESNFKIDLANIDVHGQSWADVDLTGAYIPGIDLRGADLALANMAGAYAVGARFDCADLTSVPFGTADLRASQFAGAVVSGADFHDVEHLDPAAVAGVRWAAGDPPTWPDGFAAPQEGTVSKSDCIAALKSVTPVASPAPSAAQSTG
jgi:uncharacterized protein YjbI with pentapeptide repeats